MRRDCTSIRLKKGVPLFVGGRVSLGNRVGMFPSIVLSSVSMDGC